MSNEIDAVAPPRMMTAEATSADDRIFAAGDAAKPAPSLSWPEAVVRSPEQARALYAENGYLHLSKVFAQADLGGVTEDIRELFARPMRGTDSGPRLNNLLRADRQPVASASEEFSYQIEHAFRDVASLRSLIASPEIRRLLALLNIESPVLLDDQCYLKPGQTGGATYLHRGSDFFGPLEVTTVWIPLSKTDVDSGCLWFLPESHVKDDRTFGLARRSSAPHGNPYSDRELDFFYDASRPISFTPVPCETGDVVLIHRDVLHASRRNSSTHARLSYLIEVMPESSVRLYRDSYAGVFEYDNRVAHFIHLER